MKIELGVPPRVPLYQLHGTKWWVLIEDYRVWIRIDGVVHLFFVPAGYRFDRATIWWEGIISKDRLGCVGPLLHDILCTFHGQLSNSRLAAERSIERMGLPMVSPYRTFKRSEADELFLAVMLADKIKPRDAYFARRMVGLATLFKSW